STHRTSPTPSYPLSLHDALPIFAACPARTRSFACLRSCSRFIVRPPSVRARRPRLRAGEKIDRRAVLLRRGGLSPARGPGAPSRSEEHTSELQSLAYIVCRLLLE